MSTTQQIVRAEGYERDSFASVLRLNPQGAVPPPSAYITPDNRLALYTIASGAGVILTVVVRILLPDGKVSLNQFNYTVPSGYTVATMQWPLPEGFILTLVCYANTPAYTRNTFAQVELIQTGQTPAIFTCVLCSGYPSRYAPLSFPGGSNQGPLEGPGNLRTITGTLPATGAIISEQAIGNVRWRLVSLIFTFTTDAVVGPRDVFLQFVQGGVVSCNYLLNTQSQPASVLWQYNVFAGATAVTSPTQRSVNAPLPTWLVMNSGDFFRVAVLTQDAGDAFNAPIYAVEEWLTP